MVEPDAKDWTWVIERPCPDCGFDAPGRPDELTWSSLEYVCHVRHVFRRYDEQDPASVIAELFEAAGVLAARLDEVPEIEWSRRGRRSDGASFTIGSISRYMVHDPIHHVWDVRNVAHG